MLLSSWWWKKEHLKREDIKRKKEKCDNLDDNKKKSLRKYEEKGKKVMHDNLDERKEHKKKEDKKRKKGKCDNLDDNNLGDNEKEQVRKDCKKRKMDKRLWTLDERSSIFMMSNCVVWLIPPCILTTPAFRLIKEDFKGSIQEGPTYICDNCWKFELWRNLIKLKESKDQTDNCNKCTTWNAYVKPVTILWWKIKWQCRYNWITRNFVLNSVSCIGFAQLSWC